MAESAEGVDQSAGDFWRQVDLRDVAGHDDLRLLSHACQEHFHLGDRRVLALVEDHERAVEGPAAHVRQRDDLDHVGFEVSLHLLETETIVQGIQQRAQVRIELGVHVAGQEAEPLARFDRRPDEHDLADLVLSQSIHGHRDGEVRLARSGRPDAERHIVLANRFDVIELTGRAWVNLLGSVKDIDAAIDRIRLRAVAV